MSIEEETMDKSYPKIAALAGACLFIFIVAAWPATEANKPKIVLDRDTWDFGLVKQGDTLNHEFVFRNAGQAVLNIRNVETSCGCTAALITENKLEPGKQGRLKVSFSTAGYGGQVTKFVYLDSDDPDQPRLQLKITADVETPARPKIELQPYTVEVGLVLKNEPFEAEVIIRNVGQLELSVDCEHKTASFSSGGKSLSFPLRLAAGKAKTIRIKLALPQRVGVLREYLLFKSNDPARQSVSLALNGYIVTPEQIKEFLARHKNQIK
jgi:hypothetical protein